MKAYDGVTALVPLGRAAEVVNAQGSPWRIFVTVYLIMLCVRAPYVVYGMLCGLFGGLYGHSEAKFDSRQPLNRLS